MTESVSVASLAQTEADEAAVAALTARVAALEATGDDDSALASAAALTALATRVTALETVVANLTPAPTPPPPVQPTGPGITRVQDLPAGAHQLFAAQGQVSFPAGTYPLGPDFAFPSNYPVYGEFVQQATGLLGSGVDKTILSVPANSMSAASAARIPPQPTVSNPVAGSPVNPLAMLRVDHADLSGLTILGTAQQGLYNGLVLYQRTGAKLTDVKVKAIPGNNSANPGETFSVNNYRSTNTTLTRVEIDGTDATGKSVAASGMGNNNGSGLTCVDCYSHDMGYGYGFTHYQMVGAITYTRCRSNRNLGGWNFERCAATATTITLDHCDFTQGRSAHPLIVDSDLGSAKVNIIDPVFDGAKFVVLIHASYWGQAQKQLAADITLTVAGVPRPDLLTIVHS